MAKRKQNELATDNPDDVVLGFDAFEELKDYYSVHPIWNPFPVAKGKNWYDLVSSLPDFPRRQRSEQTIRKEKKTAVQAAENREGSIVEQSTSQSHFIEHPCKPRKVRSKQGASYSEVTCRRSLCNGRRSRRLCHITNDSHKLGKLDSEKFEMYMENVWRKNAEKKRSAFTYLDSLWFSLYMKGPLKAKVMSWIKRKDIFSKKYIFVPIVQWGI